MKKCPYCAEEIQDEAIKCRYCKSMLVESKKDNKISLATPIKNYFKQLKDVLLFREGEEKQTMYAPTRPVENEEDEPSKADKKERPTSVTFVGWLLIGLSGLSIIILLNAIRESANFSGAGFYLMLSCFAIIERIVSGIAILKGFNWGRLLFLWVDPIWKYLDYELFGDSLIKVIIYYGLPYIMVLGFLIRPSALAFFKGADSRHPEGSLQKDSSS